VFTTLVTGTAAVPVFHNVTAMEVLDVIPTPVVGNVRPGHVITNVDGVTVDGVVEGVLLEQFAASAAASQMEYRPLARPKTFANTAAVDSRNSRGSVV